MRLRALLFSSCITVNHWRAVERSGCKNRQKYPVIMKTCVLGNRSYKRVWKSYNTHPVSTRAVDKHLYDMQDQWVYYGTSITQAIKAIIGDIVIL